MRWRSGRRSSNVEDRRGRGIGGRVAAGGGLATLVVIAIALLTGTDPGDVADIVAGPQASVEGPAGPPPPDDEQAQFVSVVLADTEETWHGLMPGLGRPYQEPTLVLFSDAVRSACGTASSAVGPFYCSLDGTVYLDMVFFRDLDERFGAPGDFARAYVVAHEVGHHVQNLLGILEEVSAQRQRVSAAEGNELAVRMELMADCLAGVWGYHAGTERDLLEAGDVEEGLRAAAAIGDDRIQRRTQGQVVPESFTHGSSEQRVTWFRRGLERGDPDDCDTFAPGAV